MFLLTVSVSKSENWTLGRCSLAADSLVAAVRRQPRGVEDLKSMTSPVHPQLPGLGSKSRRLRCPRCTWKNACHQRSEYMQMAVL